MMSRKVSKLRVALIRDRSGQDLLEYALLAALLGLCLVAVAPLVRQAIGTFYGQTNRCTQDQWVPPDPGGSAAGCTP